MVKVLIKKLDKKVKLPEYKTTGSSGLDLTAFIEKKIVIKPGENALVPTGISIAIPEDTEVQIRPRSGLACLLYTSPSPRDLSTSRMPSSA